MNQMLQTPRLPLPRLDGVSCAMLSDSLDAAGAREQVLAVPLTPMVSSEFAFGRARTARFEPADGPPTADPYSAIIEFIDGSEPGDMFVLATGESNASAFWGELFSAAAQGHGASGVITDGNVRDVDRIRRLGFPTFARGTRPIDYLGRMELRETNVEVTVGAVSIAPGELVCADVDGVVVIPASIETQVVANAVARASTESTVLRELIHGASLRQVWTSHGVL